MTDPDELENLTPRSKLATPRCNTARHPADLFGSDPFCALQVVTLAVTTAVARHAYDPLLRNRSAAPRHATTYVRASARFQIIGPRFVPRRRGRPIRPIFDSSSHRSTSGVPTWLESACGTLTVKRRINGCGKEKPRYPFEITDLFWLRGLAIPETDI